jgi:hypothetical protein
MSVQYSRTLSYETLPFEVALHSLARKRTSSYRAASLFCEACAGSGACPYQRQHTAAVIKDHIETRLAEFKLSYDKDIASVATDSGANVRCCCLDLTKQKKIDWVQCILHGLHNASASSTRTLLMMRLSMTDIRPPEKKRHRPLRGAVRQQRGECSVTDVTAVLRLSPSMTDS